MPMPREYFSENLPGWHCFYGARMPYMPYMTRDAFAYYFPGLEYAQGIRLPGTWESFNATYPGWQYAQGPRFPGIPPRVWGPIHYGAPATSPRFHNSLRRSHQQYPLPGQISTPGDISPMGALPVPVGPGMQVATQQQLGYPLPNIIQGVYPAYSGVPIMEGSSLSLEYRVPSFTPVTPMPSAGIAYPVLGVRPMIPMLPLPARQPMAPPSYPYVLPQLTLASQMPSAPPTPPMSPMQFTIPRPMMPETDDFRNPYLSLPEQEEGISVTTLPSITQPSRPDHKIPTDPNDSAWMGRIQSFGGDGTQIFQHEIRIFPRTYPWIRRPASRDRQRWTIIRSVSDHEGSIRARKSVSAVRQERLLDSEEDSMNLHWPTPLATPGLERRQAVENQELLASIWSMPVPELVEEVSAATRGGMDNERLLASIWSMHIPQDIEGTPAATMDRSGSKLLSGAWSFVENVQEPGDATMPPTENDTKQWETSPETQIQELAAAAGAPPVDLGSLNDLEMFEALVLLGERLFLEGEFQFDPPVYDCRDPVADDNE